MVGVDDLPLGMTTDAAKQARRVRAVTIVEKSLVKINMVRRIFGKRKEIT